MRYTSNIILIFLLLVILISGEDSKEQISADLQAKIEKYQKDLQTLQTQVGEVKAELEKVKGTTSFSLATAQEGIANQRDLLRTIEDYLTLPFNITSCECYDLNDRQKQRVLKQINSIKEGLSSLETNSAFEQECSQIKDAKKELEREKNYIASLQIALTSKGCGQAPRKQVTISVQTPSGIANIAQSQYQTNLKAQNICYGKLTQRQVKLLWFAFTVKNNVTNCPIATPFYNGIQCISCEGETGFFDLSLKKCIAAKGVDGNKRCIDAPAIPITPTNEENQTTGGDQEGNNGGTQTPATFKDVTVQPLTQDPIVKSITLNKQKKTIDKIVNPIEGKAVLNKQKKITDIKYVEVDPEQAEPEVKIKRIKRTRKTIKSTRFEQVEPQLSDPDVKIHKIKRSSSSSSSSKSSSLNSSSSSSSSLSSGASSFGQSIHHLFEI